MSTDRGKDKEDAVYTHTHTHTHNGILLSHKKEWNRVVCSDVDGLRVSHTEWCKSEREKQICILMHIQDGVLLAYLPAEKTKWERRGQATPPAFKNGGCASRSSTLPRGDMFQDLSGCLKLHQVLNRIHTMFVSVHTCLWQSLIHKSGTVRDEQQ